MATDVILDDQGGNWLTLEADAVRAAATDFILDHPARRGRGARGHRRALVHDDRDGLTINYNNDYPAGVRINKVSLNLAAAKVEGLDLKLPKTASVGDLLLVENRPKSGGPLGPKEWEIISTFTLWLCVGKGLVTPFPAMWQQVQLDANTVYGSD